MSSIFNFVYDYELLEIILFTTFNEKINNWLKLLTIFKFIFFQLKYKDFKVLNLGIILLIPFFDLYLFLVFLGKFIFEQFPILKKRTSMEKFLWSYLLVEPFFDENLILWKYFSIFMFVYLFFFISIFKNKKNLIFTNLVFISFITFLTYKNYYFILDLLKNHYKLITTICLTILSFFFLIKNIEKKINLKNTIKRKLFHFLALSIFTYPIMHKVK